MQEYINMLGYKARDTVTGFEGTVASICFDLYGCVQMVLTPEKKDDGTLCDSHYFDAKRLVILSSVPVMAQPDFATKGIAATPTRSERGPAEKPKVSTVYKS